MKKVSITEAKNNLSALIDRLLFLNQPHLERILGVFAAALAHGGMAKRHKRTGPVPAATPMRGIDVFLARATARGCCVRCRELETGPE
jgi:hypothetical protein